jgi:hypothetical protein
MAKPSLLASLHAVSYRMPKRFKYCCPVNYERTDYVSADDL